MKRVYYYDLEEVVKSLYGDFTDDNVDKAENDGYIIDREDYFYLLSDKETINNIHGQKEFESIKHLGLDKYYGYKLCNLFDDYVKVDIGEIYGLLYDDSESYLDELDIIQVLSNGITYYEYVNKLFKRVAISLFQIKLCGIQNQFETFMNDKNNIYPLYLS